MNPPIKILVCDSTIAANLAEIRSRIAGGVEWQICVDADESEIIKQLGDTTVYIGGSFTPEMAQAAQKLRLIQVPGAGLDQINLDVLAPQIILANTYNHERSIAEYVMMVMLALSRQLFQADSNLRRGVWNVTSNSDHESCVFRSLQGLVLGLVGFGHIGKQVASLAKGFDMRVRAVKQTADPLLARQHGLEFISGPDELPRLLADSNFLVLAAPLTPSTRHMLGAPQLALLKPTACLVNVSRADIVEEHALYAALAEHRIAGAALDVWYTYPADDNPTMPAHLPFHLLENVIMTPHYSGATDDTRRGRVADVANNIQNWMNGEPLHNVVSHTGSISL